MPRSAILTCSFSALTGSRGFINILPDAPDKKREGREPERTHEDEEQKMGKKMLYKHIMHRRRSRKIQDGRLLSIALGQPKD